MIVRPGGWGFRVVRQADHARLGGRMLALARFPELLGNPRRDDVLRAVAEHDNGWWEEDATPRLDPVTRGPLDFRSVPADVRTEVWRRGVARFAAARPYVAALVAGHFLRLTRELGEREEEARELAERRDELLAAAGVAVAEADADDGWLALGDALSLAVCTGDSGFLDAPHSRVTLEEASALSELRFDPFPFAGATRLELEVREIEAAPYADTIALGRALVAAPTLRLPVRLAPA